MKSLFAAAVAVLAFAALPALASEATFERNLSVNGRVELSVSTGSGYIHLTRGSDNQVHIFGKVHSNHFGEDNEARVREIAANPPIEQTGNIIRVGSRHESWHNISIDYEIQAPANSFLDADSGSGEIRVEGVGDNAKISTGSGSIHATGLQGGFTLNTGSGDIVADQTGDGDVKAQTGSGSIELKNVHGGLRAGTGSGDIKIAGSPTMDWKLETGSGSIEFWPGSSGFTLDASTGSGGVHTEKEMAVQGSFDRHHITGKVNGGGPTVRIETGSGDVRIH
jgi:Putative adhesin